MSTALRLPPELSAFLTLPGPQSLLIKGAPGTGKTALALAILEQSSGGRLFLSGRVAQRELLREFPLAGSHGIRVVDSMAPAAEARPSARRPGRRPSAPAPPAPDGDPPAADVPDWLPPLVREAWAGGRATAATGGGPSWLPPRLRESWRLLDGQRPSAVVIDPWEAFVDEYLPGGVLHGDEPIDRLGLERAVLREATRGSVHLVLVLERDEPSALDYLVNGVVDLTRGSFEHRRDRWLELVKLRGVRIEVDAYPFTLDGGRFSCITPERRSFPSIRVAADPEPDAEPEMLWPGCEAFARAFGRLPWRTTTLLESEPSVSQFAMRAVLMPVMVSVLKAGGRVFIVPGAGSRMLEIWRQFETSLPEGVFPRQVRILLPGLTLPPEHPLVHSVIPATAENVPFSVTPRSRGGLEFITRSARPGVANLVLVAAEALRTLGRLTGAEYTPENLPAIVQGYLNGEAPVHLILSARTGGPLSEAVQAMSSVHLRMFNRRSRTFVYGVSPDTPAYILTAQDDPHPYDLVRVL